MVARLVVAMLAVAAASCESAAGPSDEARSALESCSHDRCAVGGKLAKSCDGCVAKVCATDSYCCRTRWNQQCVDEVGSICGLSCSGDDAGSAASDDAGSGASSDAGSSGGDRMKFAVFGDCRPPYLEDTKQYPSEIIGGIFKLAQSSGAQFAVGTGDYMFSNKAAGVAAQVQLFAAARANYSGPLYAAMGNHECTGAVASNCPNLDESPNVQAFMSQIAPSGVTQPYYRIDVQAAHGTAKLLFVAANAWSDTQQSWLSAQLAQPTAYTFIVRHEPAADTTAPGVSPSEKLIKQATYTLELNGHTHEYKRVDTQHVISGNGGAPLQSGASHFGLLIVEEQADGTITVTALDEATGQAFDTWSVTATGQGA